MLESLISRLKLENELLIEKINKISESNKIYEICTKIINGMKVTEDEIKILSKIVDENTSLSPLDKETLEFILFIIPSGETLDRDQKKTIKNIMNSCQIVDCDELKNKLHRNEKFIDLLENNQIFVYLDQLADTLKEYDYTNKDILKIIKLIIKNNYTAELEKEEPILDTKEEIIEEVVDEISQKDTLSDIDNDDIQSFENDDSTDEDDYTEKEIINSDEEILKFFKRYKLYYANLEKAAKDFLHILPIDFDDRCDMFDLLKANGFNIKNMYSEDPNRIVLMILKSNKEMVENVINICKDRGLDLKKIYKYIPDIFLDSEVDGRYDHFVNNIEFLDSIEFDYSSYKSVQLYALNCDVLKNRYELLTDVYGYSIDEQNIDYFFLESSFTVIDRMIEIDPQRAIVLQFWPIALADVSPHYSYTLKRKVDLLEAIPDDKVKTALSFQLAADQKMDIYEFSEEEDELTKILNSNLEKFETQDGYVFYDIPITEGIVEEVFDNPLVAYLDENFSKSPLEYNISGTKVSRIKVLRVLNHFVLLGIEITEEVVKYAMKLNYIFLEKDLENINGVFKNKTM